MTYKVMVVDDEIEILELVKSIMSQQGWLTVSCNTAVGLYEVILQENPDVIIMDMFMPNVSGDTALATLRSRGIKTPIIVYTAGNPLNPPEHQAYWDDRSLENWACKLGANAFLRKPFDLHYLVDLIKKHAKGAAS